MLNMFVFSRRLVLSVAYVVFLLVFVAARGAKNRHWSAKQPLVDPSKGHGELRVPSIIPSA